MKPNFALNLSHSGIGILHRGKDGWHKVGEVMLDEAEFADKLGYMRQTATLLESGGITTKLVIPNSQILYTSVDAPGPSEAKRQSQIRAALEGITPYAIDDMAYDWCQVDDKVCIAAVARETLKEAEDFAVEHGFNPLSFVAIPEDGNFTGEPYFGATAASETILEGADTVERDHDSIRVPSAVIDPDAAVAGDPDEKAAADTPEAGVSGKKAKVDKPIAAKGADTDAPDADIPIKKPRKNTRPGHDKAAPAAGIAARKAKSGKSGKPKIVPAKKTKKNVTDSLPSLLSFSSRRGRKRKKSDKALDKAGRIEPKLAISPDKDKSGPKKPGRLIRKFTPKPAKNAAATSSISGKDKAKQPDPELDSIKSAEIPTISAPLPIHSEEEEQALTVFGARKLAFTGGKPRYLGPVLMAALLLVMAGAVLWSMLGDDEQTAALESPADVDVADSANAPGTGSSGPTVSEALALLTEPLRHDKPPEAKAEIATAPIPQHENTTTPPLPEGAAPAFAELEAPSTPTPEGVSGDNAAALSTSQTDLRLDAEMQPEQTTVLSNETAQAAYADTGVWQLAPRAPDLPRSDDLQSLYIASIDPLIVAQDAVALPALPANSDQFALLKQNSPLPSDIHFILDARGFVIPSAEGTLTPDGVLVFAGPPPARPKLRGNRVPQVALVPDQQLAAFRPGARPADLLARNEAAQLGGRSRAELGAIRPKPRPATAKATEEANEAPTALAIAQSIHPSHRPQNFAQLVAQVRKQAAIEEAIVVAAPVPQPQILTPSNPTRASVARLATVKNAINLRRISLIGVYGTASKRRALVRLPSGRYIKVQVGERMHGGKVSAIGESELRYVKGGRTIVLKMPKT